ncbi:MAG: hypothetical protein LBM99_01225 [Bacillales bacterium]|jgi:acyl-CoA hydrolase|nr:hypothetical protein [Bacillales bacterium]
MKELKYSTLNSALKKIRDGDYIVIGMAGAEPKEFVTHLHEIADRINHVTVTNCLPLSKAEYFTNPLYKDKFQLDGWFYNADMRKGAENGNFSFIPNH